MPLRINQLRCHRQTNFTEKCRVEAVNAVNERRFAIAGSGRAIHRNGFLFWVVLHWCTVGCEATKSLAAEDSAHGITHIWANTGEDKVPREDLRATQNVAATLNSIWDGGKIHLFSARNETVAFNLVLEAGASKASEVTVSFDLLTGPEGAQISGRSAQPDADLFNYIGRDIELFYIRYLSIKGISKLAYDHYDERHIPQRLRRPYDANGYGHGTWEDRPDHDKSYPDIAVPLELHHTFEIPANSNQSVWVDIYIPPDSRPGLYKGRVAIMQQGQQTHQIPVELEVLAFSLLDLPSARTMMFFSKENVNQRYLHERYPRDIKDPQLIQKSQDIVDRHFQMAHRHKISLIDGYLPVSEVAAEWTDRLSGQLFTAARGYRGVGQGVGNNVYSIGTYGSWPRSDTIKTSIQRESDAWVGWFDDQKFKTPTDYFLFLIDESIDFPQIEKWSQWVKQNPGVGSRLPTMATVSAPQSLQHAPTLVIPTSTMTVGKTQAWVNAVRHYQQSPDHRFFMYNGYRPASGTLTTEDDGIALRELAWGQYKMKVERWFIWESTYYKNFQGGLGETNLFEQAQTFGGRNDRDPVMGETGWNYNNGDGVLFYPGTDKVFPKESYDLPGPIASLRLKHWRRGLQDCDYLKLAAALDPQRVDDIVRRMVPKILWEYGIDSEDDPTWVRTDISWSTNPDVWEAARRELAEIILKESAQGEP
jgi:hypothetical protein